MRGGKEVEPGAAVFDQESEVNKTAIISAPYRLY